jgi:hypothetical protein
MYISMQKQGLNRFSVMDLPSDKQNALIQIRIYIYYFPKIATLTMKLLRLFLLYKDVANYVWNFLCSQATSANRKLPLLCASNCIIADEPQSSEYIL